MLGEVILLKERDRETPACSIASNAGTVNATADDDQVKDASLYSNDGAVWRLPPDSACGIWLGETVRLGKEM
jgi:hypothetical protein